MEKNDNKDNLTFLNKDPSLDDYVIPYSTEGLTSLKPKVESVLNIFKSKIDSDSILFAQNELGISYPNVFHNYEKLESLKTETANLVFDSLSFIHFGTEKKTFDKDLFNKLFNSVKDKGTLIYLMDFHFLKASKDALNEILNQEDKKLNALVKIYVIDKVPLIGMLVIQKFINSSCDVTKLKLLHYEIYEDLSLTKPVSYLLQDLSKSLNYMQEMFNYQNFLSVLRLGNTLKINVKENFWSDNIDYTLTIVDTDNQELLKKQNCVAVIVTKAYSSDFIYISKEGNMQLCNQLQTSRLILIRPSFFNQDDFTKIKDKISHYILLFKYKDCQTESIPIMLLSDNKAETHELFSNDKYIVRDFVENENKVTFRQLLFTENPNEIQSEIKLTLSTKAKLKNTAHNLTSLPTIDRYSSKGFKSCLDENFISSFYIKTLLCGVFFIDSKDFPQKPFDILILGAGIGTINHFFNKLCRGKVNIQSVEIDKEITEIGKKYFGLKNDNANYKWHFGDAKEFLKNENQENKYDIIIIDINNTDPNDGLSPPPIFFSEDVLKPIQVKYYFYKLLELIKGIWSLYNQPNG